MITGTKNDLEHILETHCYPEHDNPLAVAWHAQANSYVIRCGAGHYPEELKPVASRTEQFRRGELAKVDKTFDLLPTEDLGNGQKLDPYTVDGLIEYAKKYSLDAYRGHVYVMYGKPYIGIDGYLYHANQQKIPYQLRSRPLDADERASMQVIEGDLAWKAEITRLDNGSYFMGLGIVTQAEREVMSTKKQDQKRSPVVAAHPWQQAQKRAEWQALRRAFPLGEEETK